MALTPACLYSEEPRAAVQAPLVEKAQRLPGKYSAQETTLAVDALGHVLIAAIEDGDDTSTWFHYRYKIMLWRSEDGGRTWLQPSYLHDSKEFGKSQMDPWLQSDGPRKFSIVYMAGSTSRPDLRKAAFQRSEDGGKTWAKPRGFHRSVDKTVMAVSPSGKEFVVVFQTQDPDAGWGVQLNRSRDQGKTWQEVPAVFTWKGGTAFGLVVSDAGAIAIGWRAAKPKPDRLVHVLTTTTNGGKDWKEAEFSARSLDHGTKESKKGFFGEKDFLENALAGPALALDGAGRAHAVSVRLEDGKGKRDLLLRSTSDFQTWSEPFMLAEGKDLEYLGRPAIAASGSRIHVAWIEGKDKKYQVWYRGSPDGGKTWSNRLLLSSLDHPSGEPTGDYMGLAEDGKGTVHAAWGWRQGQRGEIWHNSVRWQFNKK
jgi:Neuraminidase (sialidase)